MVKNIKIENFKSIAIQNFALKELTILTGLNSSGKSSLIQSILLLSKHCSSVPKASLNNYVANFENFSEIRNKYKNSKNINIVLKTENNQISLDIDSDNNHKISENPSSDINYEEKLYYLSGNRTGQENLAGLSKDEKIGISGEFIFGYFENNKDKILPPELIKFPGSKTIKHQLNSWLEEIFGFKIILNTEKITSTNVKVSFDQEGINDINPLNTGAGNSYVAKILITCLMCNIGDTVLIENPELHLHPKAQAKMGSFFAWLAQRGVQVIIETHCEHLINKIRHEIYTKNIDAQKVIIYYKPSVKEDFITINIDKNGHYKNDQNEKIQFPSGFFGSTLKELLEIG